MNSNASPSTVHRYNVAVRVLHLALVLLCLAGWASGQFADDYKNAGHLGFSVHKWIGIGFAVAIALRVLYGLIGPRATRFANWFPFTASNLKSSAQDLLQLARLRVSEREPHEGIAGLVQGIGMLAFIAVAATGVVMALYLAPGSRATGWLHFVKELHEIAQQIIPLYLVLHVGGVVLHALNGHDLWRSMFFLGPRRKG